MRINRSLTIAYKCQIIFSTIIKIVRGVLISPFFKENKGLTFIGKNVSIFNKQNILVGKNTKFEDYAEIQGLALEPIMFDDDVTIGRNVQIRPSSYYGVGEIGKGFEIGKNSSIGPNGYIGCAGKILIGNNVMIGPNVTMIAENHKFDGREMAIKEQGVTQQGIIIEDDVWIGANVTILDGVTIASGVVIGAGTLVTKSILANKVVVDKREKVFRER